MSTNPPANAATEASPAGSDRGAENSNRRDTTTANATPASASLVNNPYAVPTNSHATDVFTQLDQRQLNYAQDSAEARNSKDKSDLDALRAKEALRASEALRAAEAEGEIPPVGLPRVVVDECDSVFAGTPDPTEELLFHLDPLKKYPNHFKFYAEMAKTHSVSWTKIKSFEGTVKKYRSPTFMPKSLKLPNQTLTFSKDTQHDDPICARLAREFDALKVQFKNAACLKIKEGKEHELSLMREKIGNELLQSIRSIVKESAKIRIQSWNRRSDKKEHQCEATKETITKIALLQMIKNSPLTPKLEIWLSVPSLSDIYEKLQVDAEELESRKKYDDLDSTKGETEIVNWIVLELEKYIPHCTIGFTTATWQVYQDNWEAGTITGENYVKKVVKATEATEHAMDRSESTAAIANQEAQMATPATNSTPKHPPKGKGGRNLPPSKPSPKKKRQPNSKRTGDGNNGRNGKGVANGNASANGKRQTQQTPRKANHPAKRQDNETNNTQSSKPKKKRQRSKSRSKNSTTTVVSEKSVSSDNNANTNSSHQRRPPRTSGHQGGSSKKSKQRSNPN
jgi:hypothetical protein